MYLKNEGVKSIKKKEREKEKEKYRNRNIEKMVPFVPFFFSLDLFKIKKVKNASKREKKVKKKFLLSLFPYLSFYLSIKFRDSGIYQEEKDRQ